jgi:hypothetical protein
MTIATELRTIATELREDGLLFYEKDAKLGELAGVKLNIKQDVVSELRFDDPTAESGKKAMSEGRALSRIGDRLLVEQKLDKSLALSQYLAEKTNLDRTLALQLKSAFRVKDIKMNVQMSEVSDDILHGILPEVAQKTGLTSAIFGDGTKVLREAVAAFSGKDELNGFGLPLLAVNHKEEIALAVAQALESRGFHLLDVSETQTQQQNSSSEAQRGKTAKLRDR